MARATETIAPKDTDNSANSIIAEKDVTESPTVPSCTWTGRWPQKKVVTNIAHGQVPKRRLKSMS